MSRRILPGLLIAATLALGLALTPRQATCEGYGCGICTEGADTCFGDCYCHCRLGWCQCQ